MNHKSFKYTNEWCEFATKKAEKKELQKITMETWNQVARMVKTLKDTDEWNKIN